MQTFAQIYAMAEKRKGGENMLKKLLPEVISQKELAQKGDDRFLSAMTKAINQAGFNWSVIANKWPQFEEAFYGFNIQKLLFLSPEDWEGYLSDKRVVRHAQKIRTVLDNASFIEHVAQEHGSFAAFMADWPASDQVGLMAYLKKHGSRLGGNTGQWFMRYVGKDGFIITKDVTFAIRDAGCDIADIPTSKKDLQKVQDVFNAWHEESGLPYTHISKIAAYSIGKNYEPDELMEMRKRQS